MLNAVINTLLFVPQKIRPYVQRAMEAFSDIYSDSMAYTEPGLVAYPKGEEAAPFVCSPHISFSKLGSRDLKNIAANSEIVGSSNQHLEQKEKVTDDYASDSKLLL